MHFLHIKRFFPSFRNKSKLLLSDFEWTCCCNTKHDIKEYKLKNSNVEIGHMNIRTFNGQIGIIRLNPEYMGRDLGRQMIKSAYDDMITDSRPTTLWAVASKNHPFWKNIPGMTWTKPAHSSVTGSGYSVELNHPGLQEYFKRQ